MAKTKPTIPHVVENVEQADGALAELSAISQKIKEIEIEQQESIDLAKAKAAQQSLPLLARKKELENALAVFAKLNKKELFEKKKSLELGFGIIGFRASSEIAIQKGIKADMVISKLKEYSFLDGIKTTEGINRDAMLGWTNEKLETVGLERRQKDTFYIEVKEEKIKNVA